MLVTGEQYTAVQRDACIGDTFPLISELAAASRAEGTLKRKSWLFITAFVAFLGACSSGPPRVVKSPDSVILTENDITDRPYQVVQDLDVWVQKATIFSDDPTREQVAAELKKKAAELNADAVILVRYGTVGMGLFNWGELEGKGRAVVFK